MSRLDHWTDRTVDCAIALLVRAERELRDMAPELYRAIRKFLEEDA